MKRTGMRILVAALLAVLLAAGCGDGDEPDETPAAAYKVLGGRLVWCAASLESLTVPDGASSIGNNAFKDCPGLTKVVIPPSVEKIGTGTFFGVAVTEIEYKADMAAWEALLAESGIAAAGFPAKITVRCTDGIWRPKPQAPSTGDDPKPGDWQIEDGVLVRYSGSAADVAIPEDKNVTAIGDGAFAGCTGITHVTIPEGVTDIGDNAFAGCESLAGVDIPASVTDIGAGALPAGTAVTYHGTAEQWDELSEGGGLDGLTVFILDADGTLTGYRGSAADITLPDGVTAVAGGAFKDHAELGRVTIPAGVTGIGTGAFAGSGITDIEYKGMSADWDAIVTERGIAGELDGITVTCADGSWTPAHTHDWGETYADGGDGTHYRTCAGCGERSTAGPHTWGTPQASDGGHCQTCTGCGAQSPTEAHQYAYTGSDADGHTMTCALCAHTKTEPHDWGDETCTDAGHGRICADCGHSETAQHTWGETYTDGGADGHYKTCTTAGCGARSATESHTWGGETHTSAGGHYQFCTAAECGARSPFEEHTYDGTPLADGDGGHYQTCTLAGCEAHSPTEAHGYTYADNGDTHTMTCTECAHAKTEAHAYGGETFTDAGHVKTCSRCGRSETALHAWSDAYTDGGADGHYRTCTTAGCGAHSTTVAHTYGTAFTSGGTGGHYQTCADCGAHSATEAHTYGGYADGGDGNHRQTCSACSQTKTEAHRYGTAYADGGTGGHYQTCADCGAHSATEAHTYGGYTDGGDGTHTVTCSACSQTKTEAHAYGGETYTDAGHTKTCANCGRSETAQHAWSDAYTDGGADGHYQSCTTAGCSAHSTTVAHTYGTAYTSGGAGGHYQTCADCNAHSATEAHTYGTCTDGGDGTHTVTCSACTYANTEEHGYEYTRSDAVYHFGVCAGCNARVEGEQHVYSGDACGNCASPKPVLEGGTISNKGLLTEYNGSATAVEIPEGVTGIGGTAFWNCTRLTSVKIPSSVTNIGHDAFYGCSSLTNVTIPDSVTKIEGYAFAYCTSLASVTIPASVKYIYERVFRNCTSLTTINYGGTMAEWETITKASDWNDAVTYTIICTDGSLTQQ